MGSNSIVEDVASMRLVLDNLQAEQAKKELKRAEDVLPRVARECYRWLLCPSQDSPTATKPTVEVFPLNTAGEALGREIERVCLDNELVIATLSPIHLTTSRGPREYSATFDATRYRTLSSQENTLDTEQHGQ